MAIMGLLLAAPLARGSEALEPAEGPRPAFVLKDLAGTDVALRAAPHELVLVHFFATWCEPCREELPALRRLVERSTHRPIRVFAISVGEIEARVARFMAGVPVNFPVLLDADRAVAKSWDAYALPTTYVLDATLAPRLVVNGDFAWDTLTPEMVRDLIPPQPANSSPQSSSSKTDKGG